MIFITKKTIEELSETHKEPNMFTCYSTPQSFSATTSRAILLINSNRFVILFLNLFSSKVVHKIEFEIADLQKQKFRAGNMLSAIWSFNAKGQSWNFRIPQKILTLGSMQSDFLNYLQQNVLP